MIHNRRIFQRLDGHGRPIPGATITAKRMPKTGKWIDTMNSDCCQSGETVGATITVKNYRLPIPTSSTTDIFDVISLMVLDDYGSTVGTVPFNISENGVQYVLDNAGVLTVIVTNTSSGHTKDLTIDFFSSNGSNASGTFIYAFTP